MKIEQNVKQTLKIALVFLTVGLLLGTLITYAATPSSTFYISSGIYPGAPSYTVWREGSNYFAKDATGQIDYSGTNASQIITNCIYAISADAESEAEPDGGKVFLKTGEYVINTQIHILNRKGWILEGESLAGYLPNLKQGAVLIKNFNGDLINVTYSSHRATDQFEIKHIVLHDETSHSGWAITIKEGSWWAIDDVRISNMSGGIKVVDSHVSRLRNVKLGEISGDYGIYYNNTWDWQWFDVEVNANNQPAGYSAVRIHNCGGEIFGGHFEGWRCIEKTGGSGWLTIIGSFLAWSIERMVYVSGGRVTLQSVYAKDGNANNDYSNVSGSIIYSDAPYMTIANCQLGDWSDNTVYSIYLDTNGNAASLSCNLCIKNVTVQDTARAMGNHFEEDFLGDDNNIITGNHFVNNLTVDDYNIVVANYIQGSLTNGTNCEIGYNT